MFSAQVVVLETLRFFPGIDDYFSSSFGKFFKHHTSFTYGGVSHSTTLVKIYSIPRRKVKSHLETNPPRRDRRMSLRLSLPENLLVDLSEDSYLRKMLAYPRNAS